MNERIRNPHETSETPSSLGSIYDQANDAAPVTVSSGPYAEQLPVANFSIGEIRRRFRDRLDLDPESQAILDGMEVGDEVVVQPGQALMFTRRAGEKGTPYRPDARGTRR